MTREFFIRDPRTVGRALLGKVLVRREKSGPLSARIVEVEAYLGKTDPASHSYRGLTARNAIMFGPPGFVYVYFIYGNHWCLNVSCWPVGRAGAVLFRAGEPIEGIEKMSAARGIVLSNDRDARRLTSGPGNLSQALGITRERDNGKDLTSAASDLVVLDDGFHPSKIAASVRIGITKAAERPLRYFVPGNWFVSGPKVL